MKRTGILLLATALLAAGLLGCSPQQTTPSPLPVVDETTGAVSAALPTITVSDTGELTLTPDMATVQFGVESLKHASAQEAIDAAAAAIGQVSNALQQMGVAREDLQTTNFYMYEDYQHDKNGNQVGSPRYNVSNTLTAQLYDVENVGVYIDAAIAAGATNSYGVQFSVKDPTARENEALVLALENAQSRAEALAAASGKKVGKVLLLNDGTQIVEQVYQAVDPQAAYPEAAAMDAGVSASRGGGNSILPGSYTLTARISARFILVDA